MIYSRYGIHFTTKGRRNGITTRILFQLIFRYRVHLELEIKQLVKSKWKMVTLDYKLKNGDTIEILTSKYSVWTKSRLVKLAQTSHAKKN